MIDFENRLEILLINSDLKYNYNINKNQYFMKNKKIAQLKIKINNNSKEVKYWWEYPLAPKLVIKISNSRADETMYDYLRSISEYKFNLIRLYKLSLVHFVKTIVYKNNKYLFERPKPNYYEIYNMHDFTNNRFTLNPREIIKFKNYWSLWPNTPDNISPIILNAINNHKMAFFAPLLADKLTYLITALETLYLHKITQELKHRLSTRVGEVVGGYLKIKDSKAKVYNFIEICYDLRSKIVHGEIISVKKALNDYIDKKDKYFYSKTIYGLWVYLEKFLRISIQFFYLNRMLLSEKNLYRYKNPFLFQNDVLEFYSKNKIILGD